MTERLDWVDLAKGVVRDLKDGRFDHAGQRQFAGDELGSPVWVSSNDAIPHEVRFVSVDFIWDKFACGLLEEIQKGLLAEGSPIDDLRTTALTVSPERLRTLVKGSTAEEFVDRPDFLASVRAVVAARMIEQPY